MQLLRRWNQDQIELPLKLMDFSYAMSYAFNDEQLASKNPHILVTVFMFRN